MANAQTSGPADQLRQMIDGLEPRTRVLLTVLLVMLAIVWMAGLWWLIDGSVAVQTEDLNSRSRTLRTLQTLQSQYVAANNLIVDAESKLGGAATQSPSSYIESKATEHDVRQQLRSIEKLETETKGSLRETRYKVTLTKAPVRSSMDFLFDMESAGFMAVESAHLKTSFGKEERPMTSTLELVAYELVKEE
ncbi:MAG: cytoskeletal protein RodZ, partial [Kiritimatiellia bacterium]